MLLLYGIFFFLCSQFCNAQVPHDFQRGLLCRAAAPAYSFSTATAASCFRNLLVKRLWVSSSSQVFFQHVIFLSSLSTGIFNSMVRTHLNFCFLQNNFFLFSHSISSLLNTSFQNNLMCFSSLFSLRSTGEKSAHLHQYTVPSLVYFI